MYNHKYFTCNNIFKTEYLSFLFLFIYFFFFLFFIKIKINNHQELLAFLLRPLLLNI